jgi:FtsH-binding integral membrane protein
MKTILKCLFIYLFELLLVNLISWSGPREYLPIPVVTGIGVVVSLVSLVIWFFLRKRFDILSKKAFMITQLIFLLTVFFFSPFISPLPLCGVTGC